MKIVLIGYRATGKTTVGKLLAQTLGLDFLDLDQYVESCAGKTISEIVTEGGWEAFRSLERQALKEMIGREQLVLALGGGAVMHEEELEALKQESLMVWLTASPETIAKRLMADQKTSSQRPSLTGGDPVSEIKEVLERRLPLYERFAHLVCVSEEKEPEEIVEEILSQLKLGEGLSRPSL